MSTMSRLDEIRAYDAQENGWRCHVCATFLPAECEECVACAAWGERTTRAETLERDRALHEWLEVGEYPKPDPEHEMWKVDHDTSCPQCAGVRWENIGYAFQDDWQCLDCGWSTGTGIQIPKRVADH